MSWVKPEQPYTMQLSRCFFGPCVQYLYDEQLCLGCAHCVSDARQNRDAVFVIPVMQDEAHNKDISIHCFGHRLCMHFTTSYISAHQKVQPRRMLKELFGVWAPFVVCSSCHGYCQCLHVGRRQHSSHSFLPDIEFLQIPAESSMSLDKPTQRLFNQVFQYAWCGCTSPSKDVPIPGLKKSPSANSIR